MLATLNRSQIGWMFSQLLKVSIDPPENILRLYQMLVTTFSCEQHIVEERVPPLGQNPGIWLQLLPSLGRRLP